MAPRGVPILVKSGKSLGKARLTIAPPDEFPPTIKYSWWKLGLPAEFGAKYLLRYTMMDRTHFKMRIERRGATSVLLCKCCDLPIATLLSDRLVIQSKHHSGNHSNSLDLAELEVILQFLRQTNAIIPASRP